MKIKLLILILPSSNFQFLYNIWTFFIKVFSEASWFRIMKSLTILSFLWRFYNLWWLPPGVCELCSLLAIFILIPTVAWYFIFSDILVQVMLNFLHMKYQTLFSPFHQSKQQHHFIHLSGLYTSTTTSK